MSRQKRNWKVKEKLAILRYFKENGLSRTVREYNVSQTSIYKWRDILEAEGPSGLENTRVKQTELDSELLRLQRENKELKAIVAEKELQLRIQGEMLKKSL